MKKIILEGLAEFGRPLLVLGRLRKETVDANIHYSVYLVLAFLRGSGL